MTIMFVVNSILLGTGLAMDAFSVSIIDGANESDMTLRRGMEIAFVFAAFQGIMPMIGWIIVHHLVRYFFVVKKVIPYISFILLMYIGVDMIRGSYRADTDKISSVGITAGVLLLQGISTSLDAFSVGFAISDCAFVAAGVCSAIIALVTFGVCLSGVLLGKKISGVFAGRSKILGGAILILIAVEILLSGVM